MNKQQAPYVRSKDFDHEDIEAGFTADKTLTVLANIFASIGVFMALMITIGLMAQVPDRWLSWIVLSLGGV